jgi:putative chitinase
MTPVQLLQIKLGLKPDGNIGKITFNKLKEHWKLNDIQLAHFLGQCHHETGGFRTWSENLNYSADRLMVIFKKYYSDKLLAMSHERKPELIANRVYGGRMGNNQPGDGFKFFGRGALQLTGRNNYTEFAKWLNDLSILDNPSKVATEYAFESALFFFHKNKLFDKCKDVSDLTVTVITKSVNGGTHGLSDRIKQTNYYYSLK